MKRYFDYIQSSTIGKMALALLFVIVLLSLYCVTQIFVYLSIEFVCVSLFSLIVIIGLLGFAHYKIPKTSLIIETLMVLCLIIGVFVVHKVNTFTDKITMTNEVETVQIVTLKNSQITKDQSFDQFVLAYSQDDDQSYERSTDILKEHQKKVKKEKPYQNMEKAYHDLKNKKVDMLVLTNIGKSDLLNIDENYESHIQVLLSKNYPVESAQTSNVDISKEAFTIYFQGTDLSSQDNIHSTGRGDVNILLTVNPQTEKVNMQVIPRDLFVYIPCRDGSSKLSYSGWWGGVQSSIMSLEDRLGIQIHYYAKINFSGLTDLIDALGGVQVYSHYTYDAGEYHFQKGYNEVDGKKALMFARARKMLPLNERSRGYQQMELIKGIFRKFAQEPTYEHAMSLFNSLENNFTTNLPKEDFMKAYQLVIKLLPQLQTMENHSIEGEYQWHNDEIRTNYYQYYFYPADGEMEKVKKRIDDVINNK